MQPKMPKLPPETDTAPTRTDAKAQAVQADAMRKAGRSTLIAGRTPTKTLGQNATLGSNATLGGGAPSPETY